MEPSGSENFKTLLLLQIATKAFKFILNLPPNGPPKTTLGVFEILNFEFRFLTICFQKFQIHNCSLWRNQEPRLSGKRTMAGQNGVKYGIRG